MLRQLTIKRSKWLRGEPGSSMLHRAKDRKLCSIGMYLESVGVSKSILTNAHLATEISDLPKEARWLIKRHSSGSILSSMAANDLIRANDRRDLTDQEREICISESFASQGIKITFVD
ncbi:MAG: hypothetical protein KGI50_07550 [Patescibacteria group bacterium]|nr:hypothetical protein [Patescibacteria group bacterium]MDE2438968.1 hypothetical protein [Patescibacteria group bacterium]